MTPTRIYVKSILTLLDTVKVKAMAHITGGGITENIPRVLPSNLMAKLDSNSWDMPPLFDWLKENANLNDHEFYRTFNCGIGMVIIVSPQNQEQAIKVLRDCGEKTYLIGKITKRLKDDPSVKII